MNATITKINEYKYEITLENEDGNAFIIHYAGCDLYWTMLNYNKANEFIVTKDDKLLFSQLKKIFKEIKKYDKFTPKLLNDNCFEWISEAYGLEEESNKLTITKYDDKFIIKFYQNPNNPFNNKDICAICFCLSGSKNQNIATVFSIMFQQYILTSASEHNEEIKHKTKTLKQNKKKNN